MKKETNKTLTKRLNKIRDRINNIQIKKKVSGKDIDELNRLNFIAYDICDMINDLRGDKNDL